MQGLKKAGRLYFEIFSGFYGNHMDPARFVEDFSGLAARLSGEKPQESDLAIFRQIAEGNFRHLQTKRFGDIYFDHARNVYFGPGECMQSIIKGTYNIPSEKGGMGLDG